MVRDFREGLWLEGWEGQSIWGYDQGAGSYFAQLWRDDDVNDAPTVWLSGVTERFTMPEQLFAAIAVATRAPVVEVYRAMQPPNAGPAVGNSGPGKAEIRMNQMKAAREGQNATYPRGAAEALAWVLWEAPTGPVTGQPGIAAPTAEAIEAERWAATAAVYQRTDRPRDWFVGAETALMWVRGQAPSPW
ncbi:hypothetical protein AB0O31_31710 [Kitasatospora cineracea]|uniref:hypothetical protein n=1 Tax=Kitasatospora cineracea TaxID=88074 RepID=UPI00341B2D9C